MKKLMAVILTAALLSGNANLVFAQDAKWEKMKAERQEEIIQKAEKARQAAQKAEQRKQELENEKEVYEEFYKLYKSNGFSDEESAEKALYDFEIYKGGHLARFISHYLSILKPPTPGEKFGKENEDRFFVQNIAMVGVNLMSAIIFDYLKRSNPNIAKGLRIGHIGAMSTIVGLTCLQLYAYISMNAVEVSSFNFKKTTEEKMKLLEEKPQYFILPDKEDANYLWHVTGLQEVFQEYPYMEKYMEDVTYINGLMAKYSFILPVLEQKEGEKNSEYFARYAEELRKLDESVWPEYLKYIEKDRKQKTAEMKSEYVPLQMHDAVKVDNTAVRRNKVREYLPEAYKR